MENILTKENLTRIGHGLARLENEAAGATGRYASAIGKGIIAGLAGTAAMTLSQMIEMRISGREDSTAPADVANKVMALQENTPEAKENLSNGVHWAYGAAWGAVRGVLKEAGMPAWAASVTHLAAVQGTALIMLPASQAAPPIRKWSAGSIASEMLHHTVYAGVTGLVYDALDGAEKQNGRGMQQDRLPAEEETPVVTVETIYVIEDSENMGR